MSERESATGHAAAPDLLDPLAAAGNPDELVGNGAWLSAMVEVEVGLMRALVDCEVLPAPALETADLLARAEFDVAAIANASRAGGNPVIPLVKELGRVADAVTPGSSDGIHIGATSQDILDSAAMLVARRAIDRVDRQLAEGTAEFARLAERHRRTPMVGRTLGQHAAPLSFGLVVAGWLDALIGVRQRLDAVRSALPVQYGGAVGSRAVVYELVRQRRPDADAASVVTAVVDQLAAQLDLVAAVPWHSNRRPIVELSSALAGVIGAIGFIASDINTMSRTEIAELSERLGSGEGGSSAMPHKRNPVSSVLLVSAARRSPALVATLFQAQVTDDQRSSGAWHSEWQPLRDLERLAIQASATLADLAGRLEVDVERMRANLEVTNGLVYSERLTAILGETMGKAEAFALVEQASRESVQTARPLQVVIAGLLAAEDQGELRARMLAAFDPDYGLESSGMIIDEVLARATDDATNIGGSR